MSDLLVMPEITERSELTSIYSDCHKDAYGFRPRGVNFDDMTTEEISADIDRFCEIAAEDAKQEAIYAAKKVEEFKELVAKTIEMGAGDEMTALRWIAEAEEEVYYSTQCIETMVWTLGFMFTDYGRELVKKLEKVVTFSL